MISSTVEETIILSSAGTHGITNLAGVVMRMIPVLNVIDLPAHKARLENGVFMPESSHTVL